MIIETLQDRTTRLEPLQAGDFERLFAIASDPLIWEQHPDKERYREEVFRTYFDGALVSGTAFLIFDQATGELIGCTRYYDHKPEQNSMAIGYTFLRRSHWGGAYNRSAKKLLLEHAFRYVDQVFFHIGATNIRSQLGTTRIGAVKCGETSMEVAGREQVHYEYVIRKEDWISQPA